MPALPDRFSRRAQSLSLDSPSPVRLQFLKTQLCAYFINNRCRLDSCPYAHSPAELRAVPDLTKTRLCPAKPCPHPESCQFAHEPSELRATGDFFKIRLCKFWELRGKCNLGDACRFAHGPTELSRPSEARRWSVCAPPQLPDYYED